MILHEPAQVFTGERAVGNDAGVSRAVADFKRLADGRVRGQLFAVKPREVASAPDARLENGLEGQRVEHGKFAILDLEFARRMK